MADDIYKSVSISGITPAQNATFHEGWINLDKRPCSTSGTNYDSSTQVLEIHVGIPLETPNADIVDFVNRVRVLCQAVFGRLPNAAVDIGRGERLQTARDRRANPSK